MSNDTLKEIDITSISISPFQPRRIFDSNELQELADSIRSVGIIHPPLVRPLGNDHYELVSGERRFRASQLAGLEKIPVFIREQDDHLSAQAALIENIQRVDLNPIEIAKALRSLAEQCQLNQEQLAQKIGKKRSTIANYLRLLSLPQAIQDSVSAGIISMGHAKAILSLEAEKQIFLFQQIVQEHLTVREAEEAANRMLLKTREYRPIPTRQEDCHLVAVGKQIQEKLGTKVTVQGKEHPHQGTISIEYFNLEDLDRLLNILGLNNDSH